MKKTDPSISPKPSVQVLERMFTLIDVLASREEAISLKEISEKTGLHPSTTHRILNDLTIGRFVDRPESGSYLPSSSDPALARLLAWLEAHPDEPRTLAALARQVNSSERTLMRRAQRDLGMPLSEWRQRLCTLQAMPLLAAGHTVESVALALGYASASAFIVMFKQRMGMTPAEYAASARRRE